MLKRPSSRRRSKAEGVTLNLVPILDTLVTLIAFLLFTMSFLAFVSVDSPYPEKASSEVIKTKPLQLTVSMREGETEIWSPFDLIPAKVIPNAGPNEPDFAQIHATLVQIKQKYPMDTRVVLAPHAGASYDALVAVMDSIRLLTPSDPPIFVKNTTTGVDEALKTLFPEIIFGNLLGDS